MEIKEKRKQNIAMIAYAVYENASVSIREAEAANENGFNVDFFALKNHNRESIPCTNGVNVYALNQYKYRGDNKFKYVLAYITFFIRCFLKITYLHIRKKYSIIHINNMPDFLVFSVIIPRLLGARIILDIHDPMTTTFLTKFKGSKNNIVYKILLWQELLSAKFAAKIITVSDPVKYDILVNDGIPEQKISVLLNVADDNLFKLHENYHLDNKIKLIFHGTIAERFGLPDVIEAISKVKNKDKMFLKIIGEGDCSEEVKKTIDDLELSEIVNFDNSVYPVRDLPEIIKEFHVGLVSYKLSSATDYMLPVKLLEYICVGIPSITLPNRTIRYYFKEDDCFFYDPNDFYSLTILLEKLIDNRELIVKKRENVLRIRENFLWSAEKPKYLKLLLDLRQNISKN
ncbi:glycosyltransferase family 4 protein [Candidatus Amoebophilus asiaticus]|nr:glycosyltransferase family 4 protein [Candidatus Amoebophilus asiaticus]